MSKIVYLFGAGASYGALPVVEQMPKWIDDLIKLISSNEFALPDIVRFTNLTAISYQSKREYQLDLIADLKEICEASKNHVSIDTYAKKLFIKQDITKFKKLKIILSIFFVLEQILHRPNPRYDLFFASLFDSIYDLPHTIRILSWNYDSQFEIAFSEFSGNNNIYENRRILKIHDRHRDIEKEDINSFGIYKLNGSTELHSENMEDLKVYFYHLNVAPKLDLQIIENIVKIYATATAGLLTPNFSFAWETWKREEFMNKILEAIYGAEVLVVIGYSFPYFNRPIDKKLITSMSELQYVYFQSPEAKSLIERFRSIRNDMSSSRLIPIFDKKYFYIPGELS